MAALAEDWHSRTKLLVVDVVFNEARFSRAKSKTQNQSASMQLSAPVFSNLVMQYEISATINQWFHNIMQAGDACRRRAVYLLARAIALVRLMQGEVKIIFLF